MPIEEEELTVPEDASSDEFLEDARKAVLEEFEIETDQSKVNPETKEEETDSIPSEEDAGELDKPFVGSRREAYRLAEERLKSLEAADLKVKDTEAKLKEYQEADELLAKDVQEALATEEEYRNLEYRALNGDKEAGQTLLQVKANRSFFTKLQEKAQRDISGYFTAQLVNSGKEAGLPEDMIFNGTPAQMVKTAYDSGFNKAKEEAQATIESLEADLQGAKAARVTQRASKVLSGGHSQEGSAFTDLFGEDGLPTDESIAAARSGRLRGII